jgi:hypothetical protein
VLSKNTAPATDPAELDAEGTDESEPPESEGDDKGA